jgi:glycosyltransferase involved in cell wall biosynthesis
MHILQVTKYFYPAVSFGGPVQCTYNLSKYLVNRGHRVTVYTTDALDISSNLRVKGTHHWIDGIEVFFFRNTLKFYGFFVSPGIIQALNENLYKFDVVHLHEYRTFQNLAFHYRNTRHIPYVLSCHGEFSYNRQSWDQLLLRKFFEDKFGKRIVYDANKLIALTEFEQSQYMYGGVEQNRIAVIPNGVASENFPQISNKTFKELYGIEEANIILYIGRINKDKGVDVLLKAFALLSKDGVDAKLVLAGPDDDGFSVILRKMVEELNLKTKVLFTGSLNRQQVTAAYNACAVVVYASAQEGFPLVPLETAMAGKPVIVSDIPATDFVREGGFGLTVRYGNVTELKNALEYILNDSNLSRELGKKGKKFVMDNYSWQVIGKKIESIYNSIVHLKNQS